MKEYICQCESCHETLTPILVSDNAREERKRYCSLGHAALAILIDIYQRDGYRDEELVAAIHILSKRANKEG